MYDEQIELKGKQKSDIQGSPHQESELHASGL